MRIPAFKPAQPVADQLSAALAAAGVRVNRSGRQWRCAAVWRGGTDANVSINPLTGQWFDHVARQGGDGEMLLELLGAPGIWTPPTPEEMALAEAMSRQQRQQSIRAAQRLWEAGAPLRASPAPEPTLQCHGRLLRLRLARWRLVEDARACVTRYLTRRGLPEAVWPLDRSRVISAPQGAIWLTPIKPLQGAICGVQRIYLDAQGHKRPDEEGRAKKVLGIHKLDQGDYGGWILPAQAGAPRWLLLCEGPETGLALQAATGCAVWVAYSAHGLANAPVDALLAQRPEAVFVCADHDLPDRHGHRAGQEAAAALRTRIHAAGASSHLLLPEQPGSDWLDVYVSHPTAIRQACAAAIDQALVSRASLR